MTKLVIVESPTKAKTIRGYLPKDYHVEASMGHVRDLPASAAEVPEIYKGEPWSRLGVNVDKAFDSTLRGAEREEEGRQRATPFAQRRR